MLPWTLSPWLHGPSGFHHLRQYSQATLLSQCVTLLQPGTLLHWCSQGGASSVHCQHRQSQALLSSKSPGLTGLFQNQSQESPTTWTWLFKHVTSCDGPLSYNSTPHPKRRDTKESQIFGSPNIHQALTQTLDLSCSLFT